MKRILAGVDIILIVVVLPRLNFIDCPGSPPALVCFRGAPSQNSYLATIDGASDALTGINRPGDIAQDIYGFRALISGRDPYAILGPALASIGVDWPLDYPSAHPPTSFLLTAPIAWLPWPRSFLAWTWLMIAALLLSFHAAGFTWKTSFLLTALGILWPPMILGFYQVTVVWMLGVMLAYQFRSSRPVLSGVFIALASFTKFLPAVLLIPFIMRRNWKAPLGFVVAWLAAVATILLLAPNTIARYIEVDPANSARHFLRGDNFSPLALIWTHRFSALELGMLTMMAVFLVLAGVRLIRGAVRHQPISFGEWGFFAYLSVVLLPILWSFAILPLLPFLVEALTRKNLSSLLAAAALFLAIPFAPFGGDVRYWLLPMLLLSGGAICLNAFADAQSPQGVSLPALP